MDPNSGRLYESLAAAHAAGVTDAVEVIGTPEAVERISKAVRAQHKKKRKAQRKAEVEPLMCDEFGPSLDQPIPLDVGDAVGTHSLPHDAGALGRWLTRLADEFEGYELAAQAEGIGLMVRVAAVSAGGEDQ